MRLRVQAGVIDASAATCVVLALTGVLVLVARTGREGGSPHLWRSRRARLAMRIGSLGVSLLAALRGSPGRRVIGLRLVSAEDGGPLSFTEALRYVLLRQAFESTARGASVVLRKALGRTEESRHGDVAARQRALRERPGRATRERAGGYATTRDAVREGFEGGERTFEGGERTFEGGERTFEGREVAYESCVPGLIGLGVALLLAILRAVSRSRSPLNQDLVEELCGVMVIRDPRAGGR